MKNTKMSSTIVKIMLVAGLLYMLVGCGSSIDGGSGRSNSSGNTRDIKSDNDDNGIDYIKVSRKANGTYTYDPVNGNILLDFTNTEFSGCGPGLGHQEFKTQSVTSTKMIWNVANKQLGIYDGSTFEFEFEFVIPQTTGEYMIGRDFEAVDFMNDDTPYNLHAYGGTINVSSVSPLFEGTFTFTDLRTNHHNLSPLNLDGTVLGSFSVPADGSPGTFIANGTAGEYTININVSDAFAISGSMIWTRDNGADNDIVGSWRTTNSEFYATFNADGTFAVEGNCYRWDN